jgi:hypothetical protein
MIPSHAASDSLDADKLRDELKAACTTLSVTQQEVTQA